MSYQDNEFKFVVVVNKKITDAAEVMNAIAHLAFGMSQRAPSVSDAPLDHYTGFDGQTHCLISRYPFIILSAKNSNQIAKVREQCIERGAVYNDFVKQMIARSAEEQVEQTKNASADELEYIAICLFGPADQMKELTKKFSVFKGFDLPKPRHS